MVEIVRGGEGTRFQTPSRVVVQRVALRCKLGHHPGPGDGTTAHHAVWAGRGSLLEESP
jgi:hypothetical protein